MARAGAVVGDDPGEMQPLAYEHDIPITATKEKAYSIDDNIWGRAIECGEMEDPWAEPPPWVWSDQAHRHRARGRVVRFEAGCRRPRRRRARRCVDLVHGQRRRRRHGWGLDQIENRIIEAKTREIYECPAWP